MKKKINNPIELDAYRTRAKEYMRLCKPNNIYAGKVFGNIAVLIFCFIDFWCLQSIWNIVSKPENILFIYAMAIGCALALDVPLAIAGYSLKEYHQGLKRKSENLIILILSVAVFTVAFVFSFMFRVSTKDMSYEIQSTTLVSTLGAETPSASESVNTNHTVLIASIFNGVIPLLTSISSFVLSFFAYAPLNEKIKKYTMRCIAIDSNIIDVKTAIVQAGGTKSYCTSLLLKEKDLYAEHIERIEADGRRLKQIARLAIMEKLGDAESISAITKSAKQEAIMLNPAPENRLPTFVMNNSTHNQQQYNNLTVENPYNPYDVYDDMIRQTV